jgi:hypothetical protein
MRSPDRLRALRAWWRTVHQPPSLTKRLEPVYYVFITLAIGGPFVYGTASTALAEVATPDAVATWGPALALLALFALARWARSRAPSSSPSPTSRSCSVRRCPGRGSCSGGSCAAC